MLLKADGYLDDTVTPFPGGLEERLARKFGNRWNSQDGIWNKKNDDTVDEQMDEENCRGTPAVTKHALAVKWASVTSALVDQPQFGTVDHN